MSCTVPCATASCKDPVQGSSCDHLYCGTCIRDWLKQSTKCPVDRKFLCESQLRQCPKIIINLLNRLEVKCNYQQDGCDWVVRLGGLSDHLQWCPFNPSHPQSCRLRAEKITSPLKQLRVMANFEPDLVTIRDGLANLQQDFDIQTEMARKFSDSFDRFGEMILDLEEIFRQVTDPLMKFIIKDGRRWSSCDPDTGNPTTEDQKTCTVSINNLNEFISEPVLSEYLRQNGVFVAKTLQTLGYNERSRNFLVTIRRNDLEKLLEAKLWPRGVTLSVRGDFRIPSVHGEREKNLPGLVISAGMSYWHS
ncbi:E3 ubiquitin-protein ligase NRDP1 [Halotydeus destructor]|nr:E3 ubiquitin-protein ligase NRDP1 [Halotydeus destructor]